MSEPWGSLPAELANDVSGCWASIFPDGIPGWLTDDADLTEADIAEAFARSLFLRQTIERHSEQIRSAVQVRPLQEPTTESWLAERWASFRGSVDSEPALHAALRQFRREIQFRIIWRDLLKWADLQETIAATSAFAEIGRA